MLRAQESLGGSDTHGQELVTALFVKPEMSITLQHKDQFGPAGNQALRTGILDSSPGQKEGVLHDGTIDGLTCALDLGGAFKKMVEQANSVFARIASHFYHPIRQQHFLRTSRLLVTGRDLS